MIELSVARARRTQYDLAVIALPPDLNTITEARIQAEAATVDARLLEMRELELAHLGLPPVIDGVRRVRLLDTDPISTVWEGWSVAGGERVFLRCLRPQWKADPVMRRRMSKHAGTQSSWHAEGDWPHLRHICDGALVIDRFPVEDVASTTRLARILGGGLSALDQLHQKNDAHGGPLAAFLVERNGCMALVNLGRFGERAQPEDDLKHLAEIIVALDPTGCDPVGLLAEEWVSHPPPTAADGVSLLKRCLGGVLLAERHRLSVAGRSASRFNRGTRLSSAIRKLAAAMPPPTAKVCLRASVDGVLVIVSSDGETVRGGAAADVSEGRFLPIIYTPNQGLDAQSARFLLRSWAMRTSGDESLRAEHQESLNATDTQADHLTRWLSAMARLRSANLLLAAGMGSSL